MIYPYILSLSVVTCTFTPYSYSETDTPSSLLPAVHSSLRVSSLSLPVRTSAEEEDLEP